MPRNDINYSAASRRISPQGGKFVSKQVCMPKGNLLKIKKVKKLTGLALRDAKEKTVSIRVINVKVHPLYQKRYFKTKKYLVQTEIEVKKGQKVIIQESRPVSQKKSWRVVKVIDTKDKE